MRNGKLGIAIIGTGAISQAHISGYLQFPELCTITAMSDIYPEKARAAARKNGLDVLIAEDYKTLLDRDDIDAVSLCLPPSQHAAASIDFLLHGKHVLCEKPMAPSLDECDRMLRAQEKSQRILSVVSQNRFRTPIMKLKHILDSGIAGKLQQVVVNSGWWRGSNYYDLWWRGTWENECGGCTINHAVHHIDIMKWLIGMPDAVTSVMKNISHPNSECEDISFSILDYDGFLGEVNTSLLDHEEEQTFVFQTDRATIAFPWRVRAVRATSNGFPEPDPEVEALLSRSYEELDSLPMEGHPAQIGNFLNAITGKEKLLVDGVDGRQAIELITSIYKSATKRQTVFLPLNKDDEFFYRDSMLKQVPRFNTKTKSIENFADETGSITLGSMK